MGRMTNSMLIFWQGFQRLFFSFGEKSTTIWMGSLISAYSVGISRYLVIGPLTDIHYNPALLVWRWWKGDFGRISCQYLGRQIWDGWQTQCWYFDGDLNRGFDICIFSLDLNSRYLLICLSTDFQEFRVYGFVQAQSSALRKNLNWKGKEHSSDLMLRTAKCFSEFIALGGEI